EALHRLERRARGVLLRAYRLLGAAAMGLRKLIEHRKAEQANAAVRRVDCRSRHRETGDVARPRGGLTATRRSLRENFVLVGDAGFATKRAGERRTERADRSGGDDEPAVGGRRPVSRSPECRGVSPGPQQIADGAEPEAAEERAEAGGQD